MQVHPAGMRHLLNWIRKEYDNPPVYVTENGVSDKGERKVASFSRQLDETLNSRRTERY